VHLKKINTGKWTWYIADENYLSLATDDIQSLIDDRTVYKRGSRTLVFRKDDVFFKYDDIVYHNWFRKLRYSLSCRAKKEYFSAQLVQKSGFKAYHPIGFACFGSSCIFVSREVKNCETLTDFCLRAPGNEFFRIWGAYLGKLLDGRLYFPDFHTGNIMYSEEDQDFVHIDLYGVKPVWFLSSAMKFRMVSNHIARVIEILSLEQIFTVLQSAGFVKEHGEYLDFLKKFSKSNTAGREKIRQYIAAE